MKLRAKFGFIFGQISELTLTTLFFLVPLIFIPATSELFEYNKMYLTYALAALLLFAEVGKTLTQDHPAIKKPALALVGLLFLAGVTVTTAHSIDSHVSLFGYYGRFNGGLFSYLAYGVIFFSITQVSKEAFLSLVGTSLVAGTIISIWGILEHYGHSPSCLILNHTFNADCWVQDVKARVFATLGQPNWLAAYLAMLIPWSVMFYLQSKTKLKAAGLFLSTVAIFACFIFTFSRGGNFGLIAGLAVLAGLNLSYLKNLLRRLVPLTLVMAVLTIIFATPLGQQLFNAPPPRQTGTLESGDETGNIRLIVWRGAWEIFRANPIFGTGLDTFGESFYQYRPVEMNKTSEWDFLFNRAHNEYLNFMATTGVLGTIPYLLLIGLFLWSSLKLSLKDSQYRLLHSVALASTVSYLVQNIFSFTVIPLALLVVLNLASLSLAVEKVKSWAWPTWLKGSWRPRIATLLIVPTAVLLVVIFNFWRADLSYAQGTSYNEVGDAENAANELNRALSLNPFEPNYIMQLAFAKSNLANLSLAEDDATAADRFAKQALGISPDSLTLIRLGSQVYENLTDSDPSYASQAEKLRQQAVHLDPTDPEVRFELGQFYQKNKKTDLAIEAFQQAISLKDDYADPLKELIKIYLDRGDRNQAKIYLEELIKVAPDDPETQTLSQKVGS